MDGVNPAQINMEISSQLPPLNGMHISQDQIQPETRLETSVKTWTRRVITVEFLRWIFLIVYVIVASIVELIREKVSQSDLQTTTLSTTLSTQDGEDEKTKNVVQMGEGRYNKGGETSVVAERVVKTIGVIISLSFDLFLILLLRNSLHTRNLRRCVLWLWVNYIIVLCLVSFEFFTFLLNFNIYKQKVPLLLTVFLEIWSGLFFFTILPGVLYRIVIMWIVYIFKCELQTEQKDPYLDYGYEEGPQETQYNEDGDIVTIHSVQPFSYNINTAPITPLPQVHHQNHHNPAPNYPPPLPPTLSISNNTKPYSQQLLEHYQKEKSHSRQQLQDLKYNMYYYNNHNHRQNDGY